MAQLAAYGVRVYVAPDSGSNTEGSYTEIDGIDDASVEDSMGSIDISDFKDQAGAIRRMVGMRDAKVNFSGNLDLADAGQNLLRSYRIARIKCWLKCLWTGSAGVAVQGYIFTGSTKATVGMSNKVTFAATLESNGYFNDAAT